MVSNINQGVLVKDSRQKMGKDSKAGRGKASGRGSGRRMFIANEDELEIRNREVNEHSAARKSRREEESGDDEENDGEEQTVEGAEVYTLFLFLNNTENYV